MEKLFKLSRSEYIKAKSWADYLFHHAPQTAMYFDNNTLPSEILNRKRDLDSLSCVLDMFDSVQEIESIKYFKQAKMKEITKELRPSFNQYMGFALKIRKNHDIKSALSFKPIFHYMKFLEDMVYEGEITPNTFYEYITHLRILCDMASCTEGLPNTNIDKASQKAIIRIKDYMKKMDNEVNNDDYSIKSYTGDELVKIIDGVKDEKVKTVLEVMMETGLRLANMETIYLNTKWTRENGATKIVPNNDNTIALLSMSTYKQTICLPLELFNKLKKFADDKNVFRIDRNIIEKSVKESATEQGMPYFSIHSFIATFAYRLYNQLISQGYGDKEAKEFVAKKLRHKSTELVEYYIKSAS